MAMILGLAMSFLAAEAFAQGLEGTGHDFSALAWSRGKTCTVCHDPSSQWGHALSSQVYTLSNSSTLDAPDHGQPSGVSSHCLGCHDGTVALDSFGGRTGSTFISPAVRLGPDLSTHHVVSFTFDSILAVVDGKLRDPSTTPSGLGGTIAEDLLDCDGKVECSTCHSMHWDAGNEKILVKPVETLCLTCHAHGDTPGDHFPGGENPWDSCTLCHGEDLQGGLGTSCMECHNAFVYPNPPQLGHHNPGRDAPYANGCTDCHNTDLQGGIGPSCFTCHDKLWTGNPSDAVPPSSHTEVKAGFADHKPGFGDPMNNGCALCHGANLNDGFAPSCTTCHEPLWKGSGPPSDHTEVKAGFADHKPGFGDPMNNGCTQCHGPNLDDGFAFSCTTCHGELWGGGNQPPDVDAGGPYAAAVGATVQFDASGTVDPDGDTLTYEWDFGDGSQTSSDPIVIHAYAAAGTYTARLSVSDGVNAPVVVNLAVEITDSPPPLPGDTWSVMLPFLFSEFTVEFEDFSGFLLVRTTQTNGQISFGIGIKFDGVIFWMDPAGSLFFGNLDRAAGTGQGILFDLQGEGSSLWFAQRL